MSEPIDKEGGFSTFVSASAAWSGLGSGIALLTLALLTVLTLVVKQAPDRNAFGTVDESLRSDLVALQAGTLKVAPDGTKLELMRMTEEGTKDRVVYFLRGEPSELVRKSEGAGETVLGPCAQLKFHADKSSLTTVLRMGERVQRRHLALKRWGNKP